MRVAEPIGTSGANVDETACDVRGVIESLRQAAGNSLLFKQATSYALEYMHTVGERRVYPSTQELANLKHL